MSRVAFSNEKVVILQPQNTAIVAQLVRVPDCGSVGRRFESDLSPEKQWQEIAAAFFCNLDVRDND